MSVCSAPEISTGGPTHWSTIDRNLIGGSKREAFFFQQWLDCCGISVPSETSPAPLLVVSGNFFLNACIWPSLPNAVINIFFNAAILVFIDSALNMNCFINFFVKCFNRLEKPSKNKPDKINISSSYISPSWVCLNCLLSYWGSFTNSVALWKKMV